MTTTVSQPQDFAAMGQEDWASADERVRAHICGLLTHFQPRVARLERRSDQRYPFPYLLHLTPIAADGTPVLRDTVVVVGKHLSEHGMGFYHTKPLPHRRMIVSFEAGNDAWLSFVINLTWCRFTKQGWYESGGRFLRAVSPPLAPR